MLNSASIHDSHQTWLQGSHTQHLTLPQDSGKQEFSRQAPDFGHQACKQPEEFLSTLHSIIPRSARALYLVWE